MNSHLGRDLTMGCALLLELGGEVEYVNGANVQQHSYQNCLNIVVG
jgi:hypothetical protein